MDQSAQGIEWIEAVQALAREPDVAAVVCRIPSFVTEVCRRTQPQSEIPLDTGREAVARFLGQDMVARLGLRSPVGLPELRDVVDTGILIEALRQDGVGFGARPCLVLG